MSRICVVGAGAPLGDLVGAALGGGVAGVAAPFADGPDDYDALVHAWFPAQALHPVPLAAVDDDLFDVAWEQTMGSVLAACRHAHGVLAARGGGSIVLVTTTLAQSGAPGFAPLAAAAEGIRALAKSAARQWGRDRIVVNALSVAPALLVGDALAPEALSLSPAALGDPVTALSVAAYLCERPPLTGATVNADGGVWMAP